MRLYCLSRRSEMATKASNFREQSNTAPLNGTFRGAIGTPLEFEVGHRFEGLSSGVASATSPASTDAVPTPPTITSERRGWFNPGDAAIF
jgi:hypothetical protein